MSAEKSPIKRESILLSLCYLEINCRCHALPEVPVRRVRAGLSRHAGTCKAIQGAGIRQLGLRAPRCQKQGAGDQSAIDDEARADRAEHALKAKGQVLDREPAAARSDREAREAGSDRHGHETGALAREVQGEAQTKQAIERRDRKSTRLNSS